MSSLLFYRVFQSVKMTFRLAVQERHPTLPWVLSKKPANLVREEQKASGRRFEGTIGLRIGWPEPSAPALVIQAGVAGPSSGDGSLARAGHFRDQRD